MLYPFEAVMGWMLPQSPGSDGGDAVWGSGWRVPRESGRRAGFHSGSLLLWPRPWFGLLCPAFFPFVPWRRKVLHEFSALSWSCLSKGPCQCLSGFKVFRWKGAACCYSFIFLVEKHRGNGTEVLLCSRVLRRQQEVAVPRRFPFPGVQRADRRAGEASGQVEIWRLGV